MYQDKARLEQHSKSKILAGIKKYEKYSQFWIFCMQRTNTYFDCRGAQLRNLSGAQYYYLLYQIIILNFILVTTDGPSITSTGTKPTINSHPVNWSEETAKQKRLHELSMGT